MQVPTNHMTSHVEDCSGSWCYILINGKKLLVLGCRLEFLSDKIMSTAEKGNGSHKNKIFGIIFGPERSW